MKYTGLHNVTYKQLILLYNSPPSAHCMSYLVDNNKIAAKDTSYFVILCVQWGQRILVSVLYSFVYQFTEEALCFLTAIAI